MLKFSSDEGMLKREAGIWKTAWCCDVKVKELTIISNDQQRSTMRMRNREKDDLFQVTLFNKSRS